MIVDDVICPNERCLGGVFYTVTDEECPDCGGDSLTRVIYTDDQPMKDTRTEAGVRLGANPVYAPVSKGDSFPVDAPCPNCQDWGCPNPTALAHIQDGSRTVRVGIAEAIHDPEPVVGEGKPGGWVTRIEWQEGSLDD